MRAEKQLKCDKYNIYYFIKFLQDKMNTDLVINVVSDDIYDSEEVNAIIGTNMIKYDSISNLPCNIFFRDIRRFVKQGIIYIRLKQDDVNIKTIKKLKRIRKYSRALIVEFDNSVLESRKIANDISNSCIYGNINYEDVALRTSVALYGKIFEYNQKCEKKDLSVLAIIHTYNESDVIEKTIRYLLGQGIDVYISDNWSEDNTYEIVNSIKQELEKNNSKRKIFLDRYPNEKPTENVYNWTEQLKKTESIAKTMKYDWFIHYDADEIRVSPWKDKTLLDTIKYVDYMGYNSIDNTVIDFRITDREKNESIFNDDNAFFEFGRRNGHFLQIKTWKRTSDIELSSSGGHQAVFENRRVYPLKIILKHFPLRSIEQGERKIFKDRLPRTVKEKKEKGWHIQYDNVASSEDFIYDKENLHKFSDNVRERYLLELLTGCGIDRQ